MVQQWEVIGEHSVLDI